MKFMAGFESRPTRFDPPAEILSPEGMLRERFADARLRMTGWDIKQKKPKWAFSSRCPQGDYS
jgi:hypothetical protein